MLLQECRIWWNISIYLQPISYIHQNYFMLYVCCRTSCLTLKKKIYIFFPVAISLSRNTSVCLQAADFYERRQVDLQGKYGVYSQHIHATSAIKLQQELLCPQTWSIRCFCTISGAMLKTCKGYEYRQKLIYNMTTCYQFYFTSILLHLFTSYCTGKKYLPQMNHNFWKLESIEINFF